VRDIEGSTKDKGGRGGTVYIEEEGEG